MGLVKDPPMAFYTITTLYLDLDEQDVVRTRVIGWFWTEEDARRCASKNGCDWIEAGHYNFAVVEKWTTPRLYCHSAQEWWYSVRMRDGGKSSKDLVIEGSARPEMFKNSCGYGAFG